MAVVRCNKEHYYDDAKYKSCPHCEDEQKRIRRETSKGDINEMETGCLPFVLEPCPNGEKTVNVMIENTEPSPNDVTLGTYYFGFGTRLLAGWLVGIKGWSKGRDYRLYYGWNRIGRGADMDVMVSEDRKISSTMHAAVVFDDKKAKTYLVNGQGSLTYLNDRLLAETEVLRDGDVVRMGDSQFIFVEFCKEGRKWEDL